MTDPTKDHKRVCEDGKRIGRAMARIADKSCAKLAAEGEPDERCKSCAFTLGTVPNGCLQTQFDVMKAVIEGVPFLCHQADKKGHVCHGWFSARVAFASAERIKGKFEISAVPWEFSPPDEVST